jgi:hypothetical protein
VLYDSASFITSLTNVTETSSKLSLKFRFDGELLRSKIYQGTVRSLLRRAIHGSNGSKVISESAKSFSQPDRPIRDPSAVRLSKIDDLIIDDEIEYEMEPWGKVTLAAKHSETDTSIFRNLMKRPKEDDLDSGVYPELAYLYDRPMPARIGALSASDRSSPGPGGLRGGGSGGGVGGSPGGQSQQVSPDTAAGFTATAPLLGQYQYQYQYQNQNQTQG